MDVNTLITNRENIDTMAKELYEEDIHFLVMLLNEKNDHLRYPAFLVLRERSRSHDDVYPYWEFFHQKFQNANSYQRNIGLVLIAENVKWDKKRLFEKIVDEYLSYCQDEKFITARQTIQSIPIWLPYKPELEEKVVSALIDVPIKNLKDNQKKVILSEIFKVFSKIEHPSPAIKQYQEKILKEEELITKEKEFQKLLLSF